MRRVSRVNNLVLLAGLVTILCLTGCATRAEKVAQAERILQSKLYVTTYSEVCGSWGPPQSRAETKDGFVAAWSRSKTTYTAVPVSGFVYAAPQTRGATIILTFDKDEVLTDYKINAY